MSSAHTFMVIRLAVKVSKTERWSDVKPQERVERPLVVVERGK